jgi:voltage-gated potassium channel
MVLSETDELKSPADVQKKSIIIFGGGQRGMAIAQWFGDQTKNVLVVTNDENEKTELESAYYHVRLIDYTNDEKLQEIGIGKWVTTIFCMFQEAAQNVFVTLSARALAPNLRILCIADNGSGQKLLAAGATKVIDPYKITGNRISELIRRPLMVEALEYTILGQANLNLAEIKIAHDSNIKGKRLSEINLDQYNLILLGVVDQDMSDKLIFNTRGQDHQLDLGDYLVVIGPVKDIQQLRDDI